MNVRPGRAIGWMLVRRHRWGLIALAAYFLFLAVVKLTLLTAGRTVVFHEAASFALVVVLPLTATFLYLIAVVSFGLEGDLAAAQSMYPARMFTLPLTAGALAAWPMVYGCGGAAALWIATRICAVWPSGIPVPIVWPGFLAASLVAWTQALTWMPYPARGLRVIAAVLWLCVIDTIVLLALNYQATERVMLAILAPQVPLAYVTARFGLARARRGGVPTVSIAAPRRGGVDGPARQRPFRSPSRAQVWFEWRRHGRSLPLLVGMLLPFELCLLFIFRDTPVLVLETLVMVCGTPGFMAGFVAATVSRPGSRAGDAFGLAPFIATKPISTGTLVAAPLEATLWSTAAAWLLIVVAVPLGLTLSGTWPVVLDRVARTEGVFGPARTMAIALLGCAGFVAWTWKRLVQGLYVGLTGRAWLAKANAFGTLVLLLCAGLVLWLARIDAVLAWIWDAVPWILIALAALKMMAAAWIFTRVFRARLMTDGTLVAVAACWCGAVFVLYGVLVWFVDTPFVPHYLLLLAAIVTVPLSRLSASPLALAWNRHR